jgi:hypothetical protein
MSGLKNIKVNTRPPTHVPDRSQSIVATEPMKKLSLVIPESLHAELKARAALERTTIREIMIAAFRAIMATPPRHLHTDKTRR